MKASIVLLGCALAGAGTITADVAFAQARLPGPCGALRILMPSYKDYACAVGSNAPEGSFGPLGMVTQSSLLDAPCSLSSTSVISSASYGDKSFVLAEDIKYDAEAGLPLGNYSAYLPNISIKGSYSGTVKVSLAFRNIHHQGLKSVGGALSTANNACRISICAAQALVADAVYAQPTIRVETVSKKEGSFKGGWKILGAQATVLDNTTTTFELTSSDVNTLILHRLVDDVASKLGVVCQSVPLNFDESVTVPLHLSPVSTAVSPKSEEAGIPVVSKTVASSIPSNLMVVNDKALTFDGSIPTAALSNLKLDTSESLSVWLSVQASSLELNKKSGWMLCQAAVSPDATFSGICSAIPPFPVQPNGTLSIEVKSSGFQIVSASQKSVPARTVPIKATLSKVRVGFRAVSAPQAAPPPPAAQPRN